MHGILTASLPGICLILSACSAKKHEETPPESTPSVEPIAAPLPVSRQTDGQAEKEANSERKGKPDVALETPSGDGGAGEMFEGFSPETRVDRLSRSEARRLCNLDRSIRNRRADRHQEAGLGCKLAAATFARSREGCRSFYRNCMARQVSRPQSEDVCKDLDPAACRITVAEFAACRRAEQRVILELLEKLDCDYQGPRLTAAPPTPECDIPKKRCPVLFEYPTRPPRRARRDAHRDKGKK
jgi:hypothetical protein